MLAREGPGGKDLSPPAFFFGGIRTKFFGGVSKKGLR